MTFLLYILYAFPAATKCGHFILVNTCFSYVAL